MSVTIRVGDEVQVRVSRRAESRRASARQAEGKRAESTRGKVIAVDAGSGTVTVEGHNLRIRHLKRSTRHPEGGRLEREAPVPASKVMLVASDGKPVRLSDAVRDGGRIVRRAGK